MAHIDEFIALSLYSFFDLLVPHEIPRAGNHGALGQQLNRWLRSDAATAEAQTAI
ncbi:hypothetical protein [Bradyrhizobium sp. 188]|uniref:hypothetical protein n=1 Tax=Bradyrhizobium sp. 188 TaxID=2782656 RepID=UPI001FFABCF5|nr:hypothetical protein [Bradyrhizobium sp. 188]MCK1502149.1 hypothetical protein [Bradyrhizobium sp. 188]